MLVSDSTVAPSDFEISQRFEVGALSRTEEVECLVGTFRNYAENALMLHLRRGYAFRSRLPTPTLSFAHPRHLYRIMRSNVLNYPKDKDYDFLRPLLGNGIFVSEGDLWTRQRRLLGSELRQGAVSRFLPVLVESVEAMFAEWERGGERAPRDIAHDMMRLTLWGVGGALFKSDFRAEAEEIGDALEVCLSQATLQMISMGLLRPWMPTPGNRKAQRAERRLNTIVRGLIDKSRAGGEAGDMLSRLLAAKDAETGARMSDQQAQDEVKSLILAGHETTSLALSWTFYLLSRHPEIEARLVEEVCRVLGSRSPTVEDVPRLEYTRMVFLETMRLYPPVPAVLRVAREADSFDGIEVAAGERIALSVYVTHRHPELWSQPEVFDPERFAPARASSIVPFSYLPFLFGRRACVGEHFAMLEGVVALAMIVSRYRLERDGSGPIGTRPIMTLRLAEPLRMRVRRREAPRSTSLPA